MPATACPAPCLHLNKQSLLNCLARTPARVTGIEQQHVPRCNVLFALREADAYALAELWHQIAGGEHGILRLDQCLGFSNGLQLGQPGQVGPRKEPGLCQRQPADHRPAQHPGKAPLGLPPLAIDAGHHGHHRQGQAVVKRKQKLKQDLLRSNIKRRKLFTHRS